MLKQRSFTPEVSDFQRIVHYLNQHMKIKQEKNNNEYFRSLEWRKESFTMFKHRIFVSKIRPRKTNATSLPHLMYRI